MTPNQLTGREIKFRAWDKKRKKIFQMSVGTNYNPHFLVDLKSFGGGIQELFDPDLELMQYTGLRDKNGKEIYEGDIVRWGSILKGNEVIFKEGKFMIKDIEDPYWKACEIIGNIYENKELL